MSESRVTAAAVESKVNATQADVDRLDNKVDEIIQTLVRLETVMTHASEKLNGVSTDVADLCSFKDTTKPALDHLTSKQKETSDDVKTLMRNPLIALISGWPQMFGVAAMLIGAAFFVSSSITKHETNITNLTEAIGKLQQSTDKRFDQLMQTTTGVASQNASSAKKVTETLEKQTEAITRLSVPRKSIEETARVTLAGKYSQDKDGSYHFWFVLPRPIPEDKVANAKVVARIASPLPAGSLVDGSAVVQLTGQISKDGKFVELHLFLSGVKIADLVGAKLPVFADVTIAIPAE